MKLKTWLILGLLLLIALFATNPDQEKLYRKALQEEFGMSDIMFSKAKYGMIELKYDYKSWYVCGVLKSEDEKLAYIGFFNQVIKL